ncbi:hypothetical protein J4Q44_G00373240 [Coregonus suidteri]|uniref:Immunoglobulin domain-containing protein n=1 Tax=Coregonus suidteri TaxID=861788 RepID=A0AAN8KNC0_9TELE
MDFSVSNPRCSIRWYKGSNVILPSEHFEICSEGCYRKLVIQQVALDDEGTYSVQVGEHTCSAKLTVEAQSLLMVRELKSVAVVAPDEACFECEVSVPVLKAPVWSLMGEALQQGPKVSLEKMGNVHRLTLRQTSVDMNGQEQRQAPRQDIRWYKGSNVILPSEHFEICSEGCYRKLVIQQVALDDEGTYSVQVGEHTCSAKLTVEAQSLLMVRELKSVAVVAPDEACFECEVSVPMLKAPVWSLKGEALQQGPKVSLEKMGNVHRLTLRQTSVDMNGLVEFTSGKAKSSAKLHVKILSMGIDI